MTIKGLTLQEQKELNLLKSKLWAGKSSLVVTETVANDRDYQRWLELTRKRESWIRVNV